MEIQGPQGSARDGGVCIAGAVVGYATGHVDVVVDQGELVAAAVLVPARLKSPSAHITSLI